MLYLRSDPPDSLLCNARIRMDTHWDEQYSGIQFYHCVYVILKLDEAQPILLCATAKPIPEPDILIDGL